MTLFTVSTSSSAAALRAGKDGAATDLAIKAFFVLIAAVPF
jgi:hypothetical protein